jgi:DNA-binding transcriptional LysR family regulator
VRGLDWDDFRVVTAVAREGSYTRAAKSLSITQSAVSRRVARLEKVLGARLFDRGTRGVTPTSVGTRLLNFANGAEVMLTQAVGSVQEDVRRANGDCKLILGDGLASYWMPPLLSAFFERNPAIDLKLFTTSELGINQTPPFDIQIDYTHPAEDQRVALRIGTAHFMLFAAPEYILRFGLPRDLQDLHHHRVADAANRLTERGLLASWASLNQETVMKTNSSVVLCEAVRRGSVIGLLPTYLAVLDPRLVPILPDVHFPCPVFLCFERGVRSKAAVDATIDYLRDFAFDPRHMPWFLDNFVPPQKDWKRIFDSCLERAADNNSPHAATGS